MKATFVLVVLAGLLAVSQVDAAFGIPGFGDVQKVIDKTIGDLQGIAGKLPMGKMPFPGKLPFPGKAPSAPSAPAEAPAAEAAPEQPAQAPEAPATTY